MSLAFDAVERLRGVVSRLGHQPVLPAVSACQRRADQLVLPDKAPLPLAPFETEALRARLRDACMRGHLEDIARSDLRRSPYVFWGGNASAAQFPGLLMRFLETAFVRQIWLLEAIEAWLRDFAPEQAGFAQAGESIAALISRARHPKVRGWAAVQQRFAILTPSAGPGRVSQALLQGPEDVAQIMSFTGMDDPARAQGKFFRYTLDAMLDALPTALRQPTAHVAWSRAIEVLEVRQPGTDRHGRATERRSLRFGEAAGRLARASLAPWLNGQAPAHAPKAAIEVSLLALVGDPRLEPLRWKDAGESATALMCSWLASQTLETFLKLISRAGADRQWEHREAFWRACLRKAERPEVWIVLGTQLAGQAGLSRELNGSFGRMPQVDQAVLLMRLGNIVFSEWSNVGALRAWDVGDKACPPLYRTETYGIHALKSAGLEFPPHPVYGGSATRGGGLRHDSPTRGLWQGRAAALLRQKVGLTLTQHDYMPK